MSDSRYGARSEVDGQHAWEKRLERWFELHGTSVAVFMLMVGLLARLRAASGTFLNPDEALHFLLANQATWRLAYHASLTNAHPPLLTWVLFLWRGVGRSEFSLRLPSVICGTAFCWIFFKWVTRLFGPSSGFIGLVLANFLPPLIELSTEVRQYALLLFFLSGAAYLLERAFNDNSAGFMLLSATSLYLAMLSHYSAILFAAAIGGYSLLRLIGDHASPRIWVAWALAQAGAVGLFAALYVTHISRLKGDYAAGTINGWLGNSFFRPGHDNPILFVIARSGGVFQYVFGQLVVGDMAFLVFILGGVWLCRDKAWAADSRVSGRQLAILLVLPFAAGAGASVARIYPYGGTRHSAFLIMFALAGVSFALAKLVRERIARGIVLAILVVTVCAAIGKPHRPYMLREDQNLAEMDGALEFIRHNIAPAQPIFVDHQTSLLLNYYLCPEQPVFFDTSIAGLKEARCGGYRIVSNGPTPYIFTPESFLPRWNEFIATYNLKTGERAWVIQAGWEIYLVRDLQSGMAEFRELKSQSFGRNITVFSLTVK